MAKHRNVGRIVQGVAAEMKQLIRIAWQQYQIACAKQQAHKQEHLHVAAVVVARWLEINFEQFFEGSCWHYRF